MMARPEHYEAFVDAARFNKVALGWGHNNVRAWARARGWPTPLFGLKKVLIAKMAESRQNFYDAMVHAGIDVYIPDDSPEDMQRRESPVPEYSAFNLDKFRFAGLEMDGSRVLAQIVESDGLADRASYTQDECEIYALLTGAIETIASGDTGRKVRRNRDELLKAFNAIRTYKAQNGILLDVSDAKV